MLQRLGIRGKLLMVVAVPTIVLLLATALVVWTANSDLTTARDSSQMVDLVGEAAPLLETLQTERSSASNYLRAVNDGNAKRITTRTDVNTTLATLNNLSTSDASLAPLADAVSVIVAGSETEPGLEALRVVGTVDTATAGFPAWPTPEDVQAASEGFERIAVAIAALIPQAPAGDFRSALIELPDLVRAEAEATSTYVTDGAAYSAELPDVFGDANAAELGYRAAAKEAAGSDASPSVVQIGGDIADQLDDLEGLRSRIEGGTILPRAAELQYTALIGDLLTQTRGVANSVSDRDLAAYLGAYVSMEELFESMRVEEVYVARKIREGYWVLGELTQFQSLYFASDNALNNARLAVEPLSDITPVPEFGASYSLAERSGYATIRNRLLDDPTGEALVSQRTAEWELQVAEELEVMVPIRESIFDKVEQDTAALVRNSVIQLVATAVIAILVFVVSQFITQAIARRIIGPLRRLTTTATAVRQELPRLVERVAMPGQTVDVSEVQIPVESQDEVGRLAEAFNSVNAATLSIAAEQAALRGSISEMFVNVARRDQVLLNRQLASIDEMERTEDNQETLTKLFALDHLATRMRRNSESLLVLAGIDTGRRLRQPMPLSDVIRTASSEIELYERVQLELDADPAMLGHSALTAAHLFAELLENATVFSDPGTQVIVRTAERDGAFVVSVIDSGIGMTPQELAEANSRVASTAASEILGAQRLGLFVVGRIARRVGARVHLDSAEGRGTEATVVMPPSLFDASAGFSTGHVSASTADDRLRAPAALVHHQQNSEEVRVAVHSARGVAAYQPTAIEQGAILAGRPADPIAPAPLPLKAREVEPRVSAAPEAPSALDIGSLVAADAAQAPIAVPVDIAGLTEGVTAVGLPTRRRRDDVGPESPSDTNSIIGLPQRASDEQLSALQSAATGGFTPILAADEVSPESAEARARVFRGFRPLRGNEGEALDIAPDAESLGHAVRRGASPHDSEATSSPFPGLEPEAATPNPFAPPSSFDAATHGAVADVAPPVEGPGGASTFEPDQNAPDSGSEVMRNWAVEAADPRDQHAPVVTQSPLITAGYVEDESLIAGRERLEAHAPIAMLVPQLEEDEAPPVAAPPVRERNVGGPVDLDGPGVDSASLYDRAPAVGANGMAVQGGTPQEASPYSDSSYGGPSYGTTPVDSSPYASSPYGTAPYGAAQYGADAYPAAPFATSPSGTSPTAASPVAASPVAADPSPAAQVYRSPLYPAPADGWQQPSQPEPQFESDPVTSVPSLDELILGGASGSSADDKGGFFSRLFGKGGKASAPAAQQGAPFGPPTGSVPTHPAPSWASTAGVPVQRLDEVAPQAPAALSPYDAPPSPVWGSESQALGEREAGQREEHAGFATLTPEQSQGGFRPMNGAAPAAHDDASPQWTTLAPMSSQFQAPYAEQAPSQAEAPAPFGAGPFGAAPFGAAPFGNAPLGDAPAERQNYDAAPYQAGPSAFGVGELGTVYSPDQLARPLGWETAGASALQAAAPEAATEYQPVVQITPEQNGGGQEDFASAVFSELSSLAAERPKVEKTRAGLAKRTPVAREEEPEVPVAPAALVPRDAEAVRSRFSAFYSGTQRARDDVQNFNDSTQGSLTES